MNKKRITRLIVSRKIKNELTRQKITRKKMSEDLEINYFKICDWVRGRTFPNSYYLEKIVNYLGMDMDTLFDTNAPLEIPISQRMRMLKKELKNSNNMIKINDEFYIRKENIERIINL